MTSRTSLIKRLREIINALQADEYLEEDQLGNLERDVEEMERELELD